MSSSSTAERIRQYFSSGNKKLFYKFFFSFMILGVIPIFILGFLNYGKVLSIIKDHVISSNIALMNQGRDNMDQYILRIQNLQGQLSRNNKITSFLMNEAANRVDKVYSIKEIREELAKYDLSADKLTDILAVWFMKNRVTVTSTSFYEGDEFFRDIRRYQNSSAAACFNRLQYANPRQYWETSVVYDEYNKSKKVITSIQSIPIYANSSYAYLITLINEDRIWEMFGEGSPNEMNSYLGIAGSDGRIIASSSAGQAPDAGRLLKESAGFSGYLEINESNKDYIITYTTSNVNDWKYFNVIPAENILKKIAPVRILFLEAVALAMLFALLASWFLSQRNTKPISEIVQIIESNMDKYSKEKINDYKMIRNAVSNMFEVTREMQSKMATHMEIARMHFLLTLFKGMADMKKIEESVALYDIKLPYQYFLAAVLEIRSYETENRENTQNYKNFIRFTASNMIVKSFDSKFIAYSVELNENRIGLLINTSSLQNENNRLMIESTLREIIELLEVKLKIHTVIGIGKEYQSPDMVCQSYNEAVSALEYISIRGDYQIMYYEKIQTFANSLYYPIEKEQQLFNYIKLADAESAESLLDEIYRINFIERKIPLKLAHCLLTNMISSLLKIMEELKLDYRRYFDEENSLIADISGTVSIAAVFGQIKDNVRRLCDQIVEKKNNHNLKLRDSIIKYVESVYDDRNLSLVAAADHFHVTAPYLSRFFKDQTGYNFNDYVNRYRIRKAKAFMEESDLSIAEISEKVGYNSSGTFIRIFKKYESITPGQYKESLVQGNTQ